MLSPQYQDRQRQYTDPTDELDQLDLKRGAPAGIDVDGAQAAIAGLLVAHHPLPFRGVARIDYLRLAKAPSGS
ncbi:hypothetical protein QFZ79_000273 [Arthrobacter sp. V4I6]|uniref:hypothetical protein n=1 Tax=unclassified Arthrobacter TaxID=235627 RepID=UPI002780DD3D|nr:MULTISPECIES: hypothetical protein [unclassified Arthrobacter]MDQ0822535.1 hypothetical protein [Arthrobacter sp. V1I7]MDQ0852162.1 hypothetical protein [Arthrobacter sp. V4I6]